MELNLFQLASGLMAEAGAGSTKIMRRDRSEATVRCRLSDDGPDDLGSEAGIPNLAGLAVRTEQHPIRQAG